MDKQVRYIRNRLDLTPKDAAETFTYLQSHWTVSRVADIAKHLRLSETTVRSIARKIDLGPRPEKPSHLDPSQQEIESRAAEIRKTWTAEELARRDLRGRSEAGQVRPVVSLFKEAPSFSRNWL